MSSATFIIPNNKSTLQKFNHWKQKLVEVEEEVLPCKNGFVYLIHYNKKIFIGFGQTKKDAKMFAASEFLTYTMSVYCHG